MITLELTEEQRRQLAVTRGAPVQVFNPENNRSYLLVPSEPMTVSDFTPEQLRRIKDSGFTPEEILQMIAHSAEASYEVHPMMLQSQQAFCGDLPELLKQIAGFASGGYAITATSASAFLETTRNWCRPA